ncbi:MAG: hypothetical protein ACI4RN_03280, partial [Oscillospiraceae bacterium]
MPNWMYNWMFLVGAIIVVALVSIYMYKYIKRSLEFWEADISKKYIKVIIFVFAFVIALSSLIIFSWEGMLSLHIVFSAVFVDLLYLVVRPFVKDKDNKISKNIL